MQNAMTVDVEDYFQVSAFENHVPREQWDDKACRVEQNVDLILRIFSESDVRATFFTLGWIAERYPAMVRRIVDSGHELASHGWEHIRVVNQNPEQFLEDISRTKMVLEDLSGQEIKGYRAASYSIDRTNLWAHDQLQKAGYRYSSSIVPIRHDLYGIPDAPRFPFRPSAGGILEIPVTTVTVGDSNYPCAGGGWFRLLPYTVTRWALKRVNETDGRSALFYFHPWELDPAQPRQSGLRLKTRFRHYLNLKRTEPRLRQLLRDFSWSTMESVFLEGDAEVPTCVLSQA